MKDRIEAVIYYPIYLVKMIKAVAQGYATGFIEGWRKASR